MRLMRAIVGLLAGAGVMFSALEARALACWECSFNRDTCNYYTETTYQDCQLGCDRMWPERDRNWETCQYNCDAEHFNRQNQCQSEEEWCNRVCTPDGGDPEDPTCCNSPIVLDLGRGTLRFTSAAEGVLFDLGGDGTKEAIAWTDATAGNGFLALDRDGNGTIDSGRELFGDGTPQPAGAERNGYRALGVFDEAALGGNADGVISPQDPVWASLRIWVDRNHNGLSEAGELAPLAAHGIVSLDLACRESRHRDRHGNELRYQSLVQREGPPTVAVDVFFQRFE